MCAPVYTADPTTNTSSSPLAGGPLAGSPLAFSSPAAAAAITDALSSAAALLGVCAPPAAGILLPPAWPSDWAAPAAHFPLTGGSSGSSGSSSGSGSSNPNSNLRSWPTGRYGGRLVNASWEPDARFGSVVRCDQTRRSSVRLDPVPYAARGPLAVNLWLRTSRQDLQPEGGGSSSSGGGSSSSSIFQYVFSHMAAGPFQSFGPNQVRRRSGGAGRALFPAACLALYLLAPM